MSSTLDSSYSQLCKRLADLNEHSKLAINSNLWDDDDENEEGIELDGDSDAKVVHFKWINGSRKNSELMYCIEEQCLYISNGKILKDNSEAYTCHVKNCAARIYLKRNEIAVKAADHTVNHGSMYKAYMELQCRNFMREECEYGGASKSVSDIYEEAVIT